MYKIIIADDERIVLQGISNTIPWEECGVKLAATAENGRELVELSLKYQPDIILTDIRMPEFDGLKAVEQLKKLLPDCEFLIITAYEEFEYAKKAIELGVAGYIVKPVMKSEVMEQVARIRARLDKIRGKEQDLSQEDDLSKSEGRSAIERALRYMRSHVEHEISLLEVAEYLHMNPSYFSRYFKEKTGMPFSDSVKQIKIERAMELLDMTNLKTYEIASRLGYQSVQYFSTLFKNRTGVTPQEYKKRRAGENAEI
ncbi:MAG: response regulator [Clostridiaceae bacterium]|nr:response regulator [Clostridiaceae bacterium]